MQNITEMKLMTEIESSLPPLKKGPLTRNKTKSLGKESSNKEYNGLTAVDDNAYYYNAKNRKNFLLSFSPKKAKEQGRVVSVKKICKRMNELVARNISKFCSEMKTVGKSLIIHKVKDNTINNLLVNKYHTTRKSTNEGENGCKRFSEKWQRMIDGILENNRALKIHINPVPSPIEKVITQENSAKKVLKLAYKSYLKQRYKSNTKQQFKYSKQDSDNQVIHNSYIVLAKAWERHKQKCDIRTTSEIMRYKVTEDKEDECKSEVEVREECGMIKRVQHQYKSFYDHLNILEQSNTPLKQHQNTKSNSSYLISFQQPKKMKEDIEITKELTQSDEVIESKQESKEDALSEYKKVFIAESKDIVTEDTSNSKMYIGTEALPELLLAKLNLQHLVTQEERSCIETYIYTTWEIDCKLKIRKLIAKNCYYAIPYGANCLLSNCCNSLIMIKLSHKEGCRVYCMGKKCIMKSLEWHTLPANINQVLFSHDETEDIVFSNRVIRLRTRKLKRSNIRASFTT